MRDGLPHDRSLGAVPFRTHVEETWLPSKHVELSTKAAYRSSLDKQFLPFGDRPMAKIPPSTAQKWVTKATAGGSNT